MRLSRQRDGWLLGYVSIKGVLTAEQSSHGRRTARAPGRLVLSWLACVTKYYNSILRDLLMEGLSGSACSATELVQG